jgi:hypothetical protein
MRASSGLDATSLADAPSSAPSAVVPDIRWRSALTMLTSGSPLQRFGSTSRSSLRTASSTAFRGSDANGLDRLSVVSVGLPSLVHDERVVGRLILA